MTHPTPDEPLADIDATFLTGEVAALTDLTVRVLQTWDQKGVFTPSICTPPPGTGPGGQTWRHYSALDVLALLAIRFLRQRFTFTQVKALLAEIRRRHPDHHAAEILTQSTIATARATAEQRQRVRWAVTIDDEHERQELVRLLRSAEETTITIYDPPDALRGALQELRDGTASLAEITRRAKTALQP